MIYFSISNENIQVQIPYIFRLIYIYIYMCVCVCVCVQTKNNRPTPQICQEAWTMWTQGSKESPPSFCNGLGTIYIQCHFEEGHFDLTTKDIGSEIRYGLGKVLGTQNRPTLRLASHHCVLCLNPIKSTFNTCI